MTEPEGYQAANDAMLDARAVFDSVRGLLGLYEQHAPHLDTGNEYAVGWDLIATVALIARTPRPSAARDVITSSRRRSRRAANLKRRQRTGRS
ncbi:hypothetical protein GCM10022267_38040 [Lentzea roselyniae]|uniref:Uncharacterized protein n=1 Tax=Lentzea roselyniae TaxID=531940 RepID=A0ABP7B3V0_9PSEU